MFIPIVFDKDIEIPRQIRLLFRKAREGPNMSNSILIVNQVMPKVRNLISTRRILHSKLEAMNFGDGPNNF